jgi:hypothetical protein
LFELGCCDRKINPGSSKIAPLLENSYRMHPISTTAGPYINSGSKLESLLISVQPISSGSSCEPLLIVPSSTVVLN